MLYEDARECTGMHRYVTGYDPQNGPILGVLKDAHLIMVPGYGFGVILGSKQVGIISIPSIPYVSAHV